MRRIDRLIGEIQSETMQEVQKGWKTDKHHFCRGHLDAEPLLRFLERQVKAEMHVADTPDPMTHQTGIQGFYEVHGLSHRQIYRLRKSGWVTPDAADKICCKLGLHPIHIYGTDWTSGQLFR